MKILRLLKVNVCLVAEAIKDLKHPKTQSGEDFNLERTSGVASSKSANFQTLRYEENNNTVQPQSTLMKHRQARALLKRWRRAVQNRPGSQPTYARSLRAQWIQVAGVSPKLIRGVENGCSQNPSPLWRQRCIPFLNRSQVCRGWGKSIFASIKP